MDVAELVLCMHKSRGERRLRKRLSIIYKGSREDLHKAACFKHLPARPTNSFSPMIPPIADGDPDPTTQIPWPAARSRQPDHPDSSSSDADTEDVTTRTDNDKTTKSKKRRLTTWDFFTLSISMAGAQIAWTVELGLGHCHLVIVRHDSRLFQDMEPHSCWALVCQSN